MGWGRGKSFKYKTIIWWIKMHTHCSICSKEETFEDFVNGDTFTNVEDKMYCATCFDDIEDQIVWCDRCFTREHKTEDFDERFVKMNYRNEDVVCHAKCLFEYEVCPICKTYLKKEECVRVFVDYDFQLEYHKRCVEEKDNRFKYDICNECCVALRKKCENTEFDCKHRFVDCYNKNCDNYTSWYDRPNGCCESCDW